MANYISNGNSLHVNNDDEGDVIQIFDTKDLPNLLGNDTINVVYDTKVLDMTCINSYVILGHVTEIEDQKPKDEEELHRLSLAYEKIHTVPKILIDEFGEYVKILDISNNDFNNLDFLKHFPQLTTLICDRNNKITSDTRFPYMDKLELLWLNHCKISEIYPWAIRLCSSCPNLKYLSVMGNPLSPWLVNGDLCHYIEYRLYLITLFPKLMHLDGQYVTKLQRIEARQMYHTPIIDIIVPKSAQNRLPNYLRAVTERISFYFSPMPQHFAQPQMFYKNCMI